MACPKGENLAHLLAWSIQQELTVGRLLQMPFYHPVIEEALQAALYDCYSKVESKNSGGIAELVPLGKPSEVGVKPRWGLSERNCTVGLTGSARQLLVLFEYGKPGQSMAVYLYTMSRVGKVVPEAGNFEDISSFPGAKIGVLWPETDPEIDPAAHHGGYGHRD